jgi:hypothetical protein
MAKNSKRMRKDRQNRKGSAGVRINAVTAKRGKETIAEHRQRTEWMRRA